MKDKPTPHDSLISRLFSSKKNVRDFMKQYLPEDVRNEINLKKISIDMSQYVSDELKKYTSDIVIKTETRKSEHAEPAGVDIYILFEDKSYHDDKILMQLLRYMYLMYQKDIDEGRPCRVIIPFVFYHGKSEWKIPAEFSDQLNVGNALKYYCLNYRYILFDTHRWDFDEEKKTAISSNIEMFTSIMLLKSAFEKNMNFFTKVVDFLRDNDFIDIDRLHDNSHLIILLEYISQTRDMSTEELRCIIDKTGIKGDEIMPTLAQRLEKQGIEKGKELGKRLGKRLGVQHGILLEKQNVLARQIQKKFGLGKAEADLIKKTHSTAKLEKALDLMVVTDVKDEVLRELR